MESLLDEHEMERGCRITMDSSKAGVMQTNKGSGRKEETRR
jgi:hypothetical protein